LRVGVDNPQHKVVKRMMSEIMSNRLMRPVNIMQLEHPQKFFIDCPIDVYPNVELRRIEVPRELARYICEMQDIIARYEFDAKGK